MEIYVHIAIAVWWSFSAVVFVGMRSTGDDDVREVLASAVFWPVFAILAIPVILWRIPFKTSKVIRADLRNKNLLRDFDKWMKERNE